MIGVIIIFGIILAVYIADRIYRVVNGIVVIKGDKNTNIVKKGKDFYLVKNGDIKNAEKIEPYDIIVSESVSEWGDSVDISFHSKVDTFSMDMSEHVKNHRRFDIAEVRELNYYQYRLWEKDEYVVIQQWDKEKQRYYQPEETKEYYRKREEKERYYKNLGKKPKETE